MDIPLLDTFVRLCRQRVANDLGPLLAKHGSDDLPHHLPAYLDELEWRFNNRDNPYLFRDTMLRLVNADALTYKRLTAT